MLGLAQGFWGSLMEPFSGVQKTLVKRWHGGLLGLGHLRRWSAARDTVGQRAPGLGQGAPTRLLSQMAPELGWSLGSRDSQQGGQVRTRGTNKNPGDWPAIARAPKACPWMVGGAGVGISSWRQRIGRKKAGLSTAVQSPEPQAHFWTGSPISGGERSSVAPGHSGRAEPSTAPA